MEKMADHIFLIGFMGAGKSTVAKALTKKLGSNLIEMDQMIVDRAGMPISEIFAKYGEEEFRRQESQLIVDIGSSDQAVVSCGGGAVLRAQNVENMKQSGQIVLLTATPETIYDRVHEQTDRPLLNGHMNVEYISQLMEARLPKYQAAADLAVVTDGRSADEISEEIIRRCGLAN